MFPADMSRIERSLLFIALIFIIIIAVKMTAYLVTLFVMSLILTLLIMPAVLWLKEKGLSDLHAVLVVTAVAGLVVLSGVVLTAYSFQTLISDLPQY